MDIYDIFLFTNTAGKGGVCNTATQCGCDQCNAVAQCGCSNCQVNTVARCGCPTNPPES